MKTATIAKEDVTIKEVDSNADGLAESLGISDARRDEICEIIEGGFHKSNTITSEMTAITSKLENKQELAFAMFVYGSFVADSQNESRNPLASLLAALQQRTN